MGIIIHPDTGQTVGSLIEKARVDVRMRLLTFIGTRPVLTGYGTGLFDVLQGEPGAVGALQGQFEVALSSSPFYEVRRVDVIANVGEVDVRVQLKLPDGTDLTFQVPLGTPPTASASASAAQVYGGRPVMLTGGGIDFDGTLVGFQWTASPNVGTFADAMSASTTWTAPNATFTTQPVSLTLTVTDNNGLTDSETVMVTVQANTLPTVSFITSDASVAGNSVITLTGSASDNEAGVLRYEWTASPDMGVFGDDAALSTTWTAPASLATDQDIMLMLTVTDVSGGVTTVSETITVERLPNEAPFIQSITAMPTAVDGSGNIAVECIATDINEDVLAYTWTASPNVGTFADAMSASTTWTAPASTFVSQPVTLRCAVFDGQLTTNGTVDVTVNATQGNRPPTITSISATPPAVDGMGVITLACVATDDDTDPLTYAWTASPDIGVFADETAASTTWTAPAALFTEQSVIFTCSVSDGTVVVTGQTAGSVNAIPNTAPMVTATAGSATVYGGRSLTLTGTAVDAEGHDLTYLWSATPSVGAFVGTDTLSTMWIAPLATDSDRNITFTLIVTDIGGLSGSDTASITVPANSPPTVTATADRTDVTGGTVVNLTGTAIDLEGGAVSHIWEAAPDVGTFGSVSLLSTTWTAPAGMSDDQTVVLTLTARDANSVETEAHVTVTVAGINDPPTVSFTANPTIVAGDGVVTLTGTASDPEDDSLTYLWTANPNVGTFGSTTALSTTWTAPAAGQTNQPVILTLTATDTGNLSDTHNETVTVQAVGNQAPTVSFTVAPASVSGNGVVTLTGMSSDPNNDTLTYAWTANPDVGTFGSTTALSTTWDCACGDCIGAISDVDYYCHRPWEFDRHSHRDGYCVGQSGPVCQLYD